MVATLEHPRLVEGYGDFQWLRVFDEEDLQELARELRQTLDETGTPDLPAALGEVLRAWYVTAQTLDDPARRSILLGTPSDADFVEVERPEQADAE